MITVCICFYRVCFADQTWTDLSGEMNSSSDAHMPGWQGLTIKEILEKVDLFNIATMVEDDKKEGSCELGEIKVSRERWSGPKNLIGCLRAR
jgi:hypothetical protein